MRDGKKLETAEKYISKKRCGMGCGGMKNEFEPGEKLIMDRVTTLYVSWVQSLIPAGE